MDESSNINDKSSLDKFPKSMLSMVVDNQLRNLHLCIEPIYPELDHISSSDSTSSNAKLPYFRFKSYKKYPKVLICRDAFDIKFAQECREFLQAIPFDINKPTLNDTDYPPSDTVYKNAYELYSLCATTPSLVNLRPESTNDPNLWTWEHYSYCFYRCLPLTVESFVGSPITKLIAMIASKWKNTKLSNIDILKFYCGVIQRMTQGSFVTEHKDGHGFRKISFIYYLTPDDWNYQIDGGELCIHNEKIFNINPTFNTLIAWDNTIDDLLHSVGTIQADNSRPRLALVGFLE